MSTPTTPSISYSCDCEEYDPSLPYQPQIGEVESDEAPLDNFKTQRRKKIVTDRTKVKQKAIASQIPNSNKKKVLRGSLPPKAPKKLDEQIGEIKPWDSKKYVRRMLRFQAHKKKLSAQIGDLDEKLYSPEKEKLIATNSLNSRPLPQVLEKNGQVYSAIPTRTLFGEKVYPKVQQDEQKHYSNSVCSKKTENTAYGDDW